MCLLSYDKKVGSIRGLIFYQVFINLSIYASELQQYRRDYSSSIQLKEKVLKQDFRPLWEKICKNKVGYQHRLIHCRTIVCTRTGVTIFNCRRVGLNPLGSPEASSEDTLVYTLLRSLLKRAHIVDYTNDVSHHICKKYLFTCID